MKMTLINKPSHRFNGKRCACGRTAKVGHTVVYGRSFGGGALLIEHTDCIIDHTLGRPVKGLKRATGGVFGTRCLLCTRPVQLSDECSYWRDPTMKLPFEDSYLEYASMHRECVDAYAVDLEPCSVPVTRRGINLELKQLAALAS